jgi:hypothetical protein
MTTTWPTATNVSRRIFASGQHVPPGIYRCLFTGQEVRPNNKGCLPIPCDGTSTLYVRLTRSLAQSATWGLVRRSSASTFEAKD